MKRCGFARMDSSPPHICGLTLSPHRKRRIAMNETSQVFVTLSEDLLRHLGQLARTIGVPIRWMVAGLVCDTIESVPVQATNVDVKALQPAAHRGKNRTALSASLRSCLE